MFASDFPDQIEMGIDAILAANFLTTEQKPGSPSESTRIGSTLEPSRTTGTGGWSLSSGSAQISISAFGGMIVRYSKRTPGQEQLPHLARRVNDEIDGDSPIREQALHRQTSIDRPSVVLFDDQEIDVRARRVVALTPSRRTHTSGGGRAA